MTGMTIALIIVGVVALIPVGFLAYKFMRDNGVFDKKSKTKQKDDETVIDSEDPLMKKDINESNDKGDYDL